MTRIAQIEDRGATVAWSPVTGYADVIAVGAKDSGTIGFDSSGGELELYDLGITNNVNSKPTVIGSIKTTSRFCSIGWTPGTAALNSNPQFQMGLIAGGMDNGTIHIWNPLDIMNGNNGNSKDNAADNDKALLSTIDRQSNGAISALQFNPHPDSANLLATGSSNGEILISSLDTPDQPTVTIPSETQTTSTSSITSLAWNTEVSHIIASALSTGSVTIWDLRQNKTWCSLQCESSNSRSPVNAICWNPGNGMHLLTASGDDHCPVLKLWDLRASMSMPLATMEGHGSGVLGMDWCPHDESLVISCGKDNRTILWDVNSLSMICDLPNEEVKEVVNDVNGTKDKVSSQELYGNAMPSGLISNQQKRYDVKWSPLRRGVISTCSFDRKVQAHSVLSAATKSGRPPKWMKPASGVSCGFGGKIVSFGTLDKTLRLEEYVEQPDLKKQVEEFERAVAAGNANGSGNGIGDYEGFATAKALECANSVPSDVCEAQLWGFIQCMFKENSRMAMLQYLGFDAGEIAEKAKAFEHQQDITNSNGIGMSNLSLKESGATMPMTKEAQDAVNQALLVGNFEAAVECCIRAGSLADALVLASCGGAELWAKTQAQYFASEMGKRPFLSVVSAVIHNNLGEYVTSSDPANWYETLALICTYSSEQEFTVLCEALGDHLEEAGDTASASVCFQCSMNLEKTARFWLWQLENVGGDYLALHDFVVKVSVFMQTGAQGSELSDDVAEAMYRYAKVLADQGLFASAAKYCRSNSQECKELKDRLYRSKDSQICLQLMGATPDFPYQYVNIGVSPIAPVVSVNHQQQHVVVAKPVKQQQPVYARTQNQYQAQPTAAAVTNGYGSSSQAYGNNTQQQQQQQAVQQPQQQYVQQPVQQHNTGHYATQQQPMLAPAPTQQNESQLPTGWMAIQDPSSGRTYYANQSTGETTWEKPSAPNQPAAVAPVAQGKPAVSSSMKLASKYGDGFVTSASHPELAAQYGNVGTSNPYTDSSRPGTAVINRVEKPPVSGTFNLKKLSEVADSTQYKATIEDLLASVTTLSALPLGAVEKKQFAEVQKSVAIFSKRLGNGDIECDVAEKVCQLVASMKNKDYSSAMAIHTSLVNSVWKSHKDWLKGFKFLVQLGAKTVQNSRTQDQWAM